MKDAKAADLVEQLVVIQEKADELAVQEQDVKQRLEIAMEQAPERNQKRVEERTDLGGEA
jgi:hypothetical protein